MMNDYVSFEWTKTDITLFWLLCLAPLITENFKDKIIGWLSHDTNLFWFDILDDVVLSLILWVTVNLMTIHGKSIDKKALQKIFHSVLIFNHVTNKYSQNFKDIIYIKKKDFSNLLTLIYVKSHNYNLNNNL